MDVKIIGITLNKKFGMPNFKVSNTYICVVDLK
jgi:hypothetical protein